MVPVIFFHTNTLPVYYHVASLSVNNHPYLLRVTYFI